MNRRVIVVGAGVIGLTCAVRLGERGFAVDVLARELPEETTSAQAAGLCLPEPRTAQDTRTQDWARISLAEFTALAGTGRAGVRMAPGYLVPGSPESYLTCRDTAEDITEQSVPLVDMPVYLRYLRSRLTDVGGTVTRMTLTAFPTRGIVVDATGLAARVLAEDPEVQPFRGQIVVLDDPGLQHWYAFPDNPDPLRYVVPVGGRVLVGGDGPTGTWDLEPDKRTAARLLDQTYNLLPALTQAEVRGHRVTLRPAREPIRVQAVPATGPDDPDRMIVHCYGHGARGVALSWGCADQVAAMAAGSTG